MPSLLVFRVKAVRYHQIAFISFAPGARKACGQVGGTAPALIINFSDMGFILKVFIISCLQN